MIYCISLFIEGNQKRREGKKEKDDFAPESFLEAEVKNIRKRKKKEEDIVGVSAEVTT